MYKLDRVLSQICHNVKQKGWKVVRDRDGRYGPYAYNKDQWVGFDDQLMVQKKAEYVKMYGLGGAGVWSLDLDDFRNRCNCESYPLIKTINRVLRNYPGPGPVCKLGGKNHSSVDSLWYKLTRDSCVTRRWTETRADDTQASRTHQVLYRKIVCRPSSRL